MRIIQVEKIREADGTADCHDRLKKLWNYERYGVPEQQGGRYFYQHNTGLQNQSVLLVAESVTAEPRLLLDPNTLSTDGTVALVGHAVTDDGKLLAYGTSASGSDWMEWRVRDVDTGKDLPDLVKWVKFSGASWTKDGKGFFYSRYDEPKQGTMLRDANYFHKLYYHKLGTPQSEDKLIYDRPDNKELGFGGGVTDDGHYLVISVWQGTSPKNRLYYKDLTKPDSEVVKLLDDFDAEYQFLDNDGPVFWIKTDLDAPRGRVIAIDTRHPERAAWKTIVPQGADKLDHGVSRYFLPRREGAEVWPPVGVYSLPDGCRPWECSLVRADLDVSRTTRPQFSQEASHVTSAPHFLAAYSCYLHDREHRLRPA